MGFWVLLVPPSGFLKPKNHAQHDQYILVCETSAQCLHIVYLFTSHNSLAFAGMESQLSQNSWVFLPTYSLIAQIVFSNCPSLFPRFIYLFIYF